MTAGSPTSRPDIGVWLEWPAGDVSNAGALARRVAFLALGAAQSKACVLHLAAPDALAGVVRARLTEIAGQEGADWVLHTPGEIAAREAHEAEAAEAALSATALAASEAFAAIEAEAAAVESQIATLSQPVPRGRRGVLRPGARAAQERARLEALQQARATEATRAPIREQERQIHVERLRAAQRAAEATAERVRQSAEWTRSSAQGDPPPAVDPAAEGFAVGLSRGLEVAGWLVMAPDYSGAAALPSPRAVVLGDGTPAAWPLGWPDADWGPGKPAALWRVRAARLLAQGDPVIVPSRGLAEGDGVGLLGVAPERLRLAPPAPVDLAPHAAADRREGAKRLRAELARADNRYLHGFPFEDVRYLVAWSEGTPGLNLRVLARAMRLLVQRHLLPIKAFVASPGGAPEQDVWREVAEQGLHHDLVAMPALSTPALAALIQGAELGLCTAPSAGGGTLIGWSQAIGLGVPSLVCDGPDVRETLAHPDLADAVFDPYDAEALAARIKAALAGRDLLLEHQVRARQAMDRTWAAALADHLSPLGLAPGGKDRS